MTLAVYYPFSQTDWYRASIAYLDLQHQGLVVLMLLLALLMVSNVKYPKFPPIGLRSAKGLFGLAVHLAILLGGILAPEYFLFPLGLVLHDLRAGAGHGAGADGAAGAGGRGGRAAGGPADEPATRCRPQPTPSERRAGWSDRRQEPEDR